MDLKRAMNIGAHLRIYFYRGWSYVSLGTTIFSLVTLLIVADYQKYIPFGNAPVIAVAILAFLLVGAVVLGFLDMEYGTGKAENSAALTKYSPGLNDKLDHIIELLEARR